jgi:hypothetical protein
VVYFKHYRGPIWEKNNPTHVPIAPIQRRCGRCCCTRIKFPLQIAWYKTIHSVQGHNARPTCPNQSPNAIQAIVCDLGTRNCETLNPGMSYVATSRAKTIVDCGTGEVIPRKCTNSAIYFKAGTFQTGLKCLTHSYKGVEYKRVQEHTAWVSYLDRQQEQTSTVDDESEKLEIQQWMENEKYTRHQLLSVVRSQSWRQNKSFKLPKKTKNAYTQKQKNTLLSPIQSSLTSLLHPGISMRGYQIEDYLELVIEGKDNTSCIQTHIPPSLCHHGILYWDSLLEADNPNSAKSAEQLQHINSHIMFIPWFSGNNTAGHWNLIVRHRNRHGKVFFYHFDSIHNFDNVESHALAYTPLYIQGIDSWQNVKTPMQTEVEYGMRV